MSEASTEKRCAPVAGNALEILALWGFAVAQPIYDLLSRGADFFLAHQLKPADIVFLVAVISFLLPGLLVVVESLERAVSGGTRLHSLSIAVLVAIFALLAVKGLPAGIGIAVSVVCGAGFAWGTLRWPAVRSFMTILSPAALIFPALFLLRPPVSGLLLAPEIDSGGWSGISSDTPIVVVVTDELPITSLMDANQRIDARRYPAFAELAGQAAWFRNATSVAEGTTYAVPAILTGRYPDRPRIAHLSEYPENLFTWLGSGYSMNVFESLTRMCPEELRQTTGLEEGFARRLWSTLEDLNLVYLHRLLPERLAAHLPPVTSTWRDFGAGASPPPATPAGSASPDKRRGDSAEVFERFIELIRPTKRPVLHFLHVNLPHVPWKYLPSGKEYGPLNARLLPRGLRGEHWIDDEWATIQGFQRHLLQVTYTDRLLGRLIKRLRDTDLWERSMVIVTADHGVSFWPGESRREATEKTRADILSVPLFIKTPFQTKGVLSERNVETIDILPTLADVLDVTLPWPVDGQSALDGSLPPRTRKVMVDATGREIVGRVVLEERLNGTGATLARLHSLFGSTEGQESLFQIGRFRDLIGRRPSGLVPASYSGPEVDLHDAGVFENLDLEAGYIPARIVGSFGPAAGEKARDLAVAVNGRIRAVTQTYDSLYGEWMFAAMVPENAFLDGFNQVEVFRILGDEASPRLALIDSKATLRFAFDLAADGAAERISASDGRTFQIVPEAVQGEAVFDGVSFRGWAADVDRPQAADLILLFAGGDLVTRARTGDFRRDVAERYQTPALALAGFSFVVPYSVIEDPDSPELRFFAILGDVATQLPYRDAWTPP